MKVLYKSDIKTFYDFGYMHLRDRNLLFSRIANKKSSSKIYWHFSKHMNSNVFDSPDTLDFDGIPNAERKIKSIFDI